MGLLFRNALKGLKRKKMQMFGIIMMITLSTGIYVAMNTALDRLEEKYYTYLDNQNVENYSIDVIVDYENISLEDINYIKENYFQNASEEEKNLLTYYQHTKQKTSDLVQQIQYLMMKYKANVYLESNVLASLQDTYDFDFEYERSKTIMDEDILMKVIPYNKDKRINKTYLRKGNFPKEKNEITMLEAFAKAHDLEIGDSYKIGEQEYKIVGFTYAPDYIYPLISFSTPIFDEEQNNIIFVSEEAYGEIIGIDDNTFAIRFDEGVNRKFEFETTTNDEGVTVSLKEDPMTYMIEHEQDKLMVSVNTITRIGRIGMLQIEFATDRLFAEYFLYLLLIIAVIIIMIITKKRIDDERLQIGVLKSLGYSRFSIAFSYLVYPILGSIIGGLLGFTIGSLLNGTVTSMFLSFFNVPIDGFSIAPKYLVDAILVPAVLLSILCYIIAIFMLRKKPLSLLKEGSHLKVNIMSKVVNFFTRILPFKQRFKYSLASRSLGKLLIVTITSFGAGMLIVLTLIGMDLFDKAIESSFEGMKYDYIVYMNNNYNEETSDKEDYILNASVIFKEIQDKEGKVLSKENLEEDTTATLIGIDQTVQFIELLDEKKNNITNKVTNHQAVISKNMQEYFELEIGDQLNFEVNEIPLSYEVVGVSNELMSFNVYVDRETLSHDLGFEDKMYNMIYSIDDKYQSMSKLDEEELSKIVYVMSLKDLKDNILKQMERYNASIYLVIAFAAFMAFIIICVIASIIVEENKKTISLMKVMGYKTREVSSIVLNIYTPVVILAYLLSIPAMKNLLEWIVAQLVSDTEVTIPITFSITNAVIGLIALLVAYYIAIAISKRVLNKVPLAVALKRE